MHQRQTTYVLGSDPAELAWLDQQAVAIAPPTQLLLQAAGVAPGMPCSTWALASGTSP